MKNDKHALIVGGSKGAGRVIADLFSSKGYKVSILSRSHPEDVNSEGYSGNILFEKLDLENPKDDLVLSALTNVHKKNGAINYVIFSQRFKGKEDSLVNEFNVTINSTKKIVDTLVTKKMFSDGDKSVVAVSSVAGKGVLYQQPESYHVGKAGMMSLMNYYAVTLGNLGIRFNSVLPGMFIKPESKAFYDASEEKKVLESTAPLGRMTNTDDIANVVDFFCNEKSYLVTGSQIVLDGGISLINQESLMMRKILNK